MNQTIITDITQGLTTAFIDHTISSNLAYRPQFVSNNYKEGRKVISSIEDELLSCEQFAISVAFITMSGITPLLQTLKELEKRGIPGRILTTVLRPEGKVCGSKTDDVNGVRQITGGYSK